MVVFRPEVPLRRAELAREVALYETELSQNKKQLRYLKHIAEEQESKGKGAANHQNHGPPSPHPAASSSAVAAASSFSAAAPAGGGIEEDCPVCLEGVGGRPVMVVPCGHHICEVRARQSYLLMLHVSGSTPKDVIGPLAYSLPNRSASST